jgi:hypothetical protein
MSCASVERVNLQSSSSALTAVVNCMTSPIFIALVSVLLPAVHEGDVMAEVARGPARAGLGVHMWSYNACDFLLISCITMPMRSSFFRSDFSSRSLVFGCISFVCIAIAPPALPDSGRDGDRVLAGWRARRRQGPCRMEGGRQKACVVCGLSMRAMRFPDFPISRFPDRAISDVRTGLRHCLVLVTADPTLAALRPVHDHARTEHARHARCTVRASPATHVLSPLPPPMHPSCDNRDSGTRRLSGTRRCRCRSSTLKPSRSTRRPRTSL